MKRVKMATYEVFLIEEPRLQRPENGILRQRRL